jgi:hypothetical protein
VEQDSSYWSIRWSTNSPNFMKVKVCYCVNTNLPLVSMLKNLNPAYIAPHYFFKSVLILCFCVPVSFLILCWLEALALCPLVSVALYMSVTCSAVAFIRFSGPDNVDEIWTFHCLISCNKHFKIESIPCSKLLQSPWQDSRMLLYCLSFGSETKYINKPLGRTVGI